MVIYRATNPSERSPLKPIQAKALKLENFGQLAWPHKEDAHAIGRLLAGVYSLEV